MELTFSLREKSQQTNKCNKILNSAKCYERKKKKIGQEDQGRDQDRHPAGDGGGRAPLLAVEAE